MEDKERCLLIGVQLSSDNADENDMEELAQLVEAADGEVVATIMQNRNNIDNRLYVGKGKAEEISLYIKELEIDTIIVNDELSGSQLRNLEDATDSKVIDRTNLILDIFAKRALTKEGQLQVELAQLKYRLPRLGSMGQGLSRQGGGIGSKGPGEKKIETDRRHIQDKINDIQTQLVQLENVRDTKRKKRMKDEIPIVSIVGYTNAGKSTLLNALIEAQYSEEEYEDKKVFSHDMLFATLDTELRKVRLPGGKYVVFSDTVGFIKKLPTQIIQAFKGTLEEVKYADLIIHLIDINDDNLQVHKQITTDIIEKITDKEIPVITVYNKVDKILKDNIRAMSSSADTMYVSATQKYNIDHLMETVDTKINGKKFKCSMKIPSSDFKTYYYLYENRNTDNVNYDEDGVGMDVVLYENEMQMYENYIKEVF